MTHPSPALAAALVTATRAELAGVDRAIRAHPFLDRAERGEVRRERLGAFAVQQRAIVSSDRRSFAALAARFPEPPAGDLFLALAGGEGEALRRLDGMAEALGLAPGGLPEGEAIPAAQAYAGYLARLALGGGRADAALAMLVNLDSWSANCARLAAALRAGLGDEGVAFLEFFAAPPASLAESLHETIAQGLAEGEPPGRARGAARMLQAYELMFWDAMDAGSAG